MNSKKVRDITFQVFRAVVFGVAILFVAMGIWACASAIIETVARYAGAS